MERTDKRREPPLAALDYYEIEEVEALARACEQGLHRPTAAVSEDERAARVAEDHQDAEAFRILSYTGIRIGELMTLRWSDVDLDARTLLVRRNLSAGVETEPKGRRHRFVPLPDPALAALARLGSRDDFIGPDDYVVCNRWGRRLDDSALRRRYYRGCEVAGLRRVKLHGLRLPPVASRARRRPGVRGRLPGAFEAQHHRWKRWLALAGGVREAEPGIRRRPARRRGSERCGRPARLSGARLGRDRSALTSAQTCFNLDAWLIHYEYGEIGCDSFVPVATGGCVRE